MGITWTGDGWCTIPSSRTGRFPGNRALRRALVAAVLIAGTRPTTAAEPIKLHPDNPHYFLFRGKPTVLITSGEHYGAVINLDFDYRRYLKTLESH